MVRCSRYLPTSACAKRRLPTVPMGELLGGQALGGLEVGALRVRDREEPALGVALERNAEDLGNLPLAITHQVKRGPCRPESARAKGEHEAPHRWQQRAPETRGHACGRAVRTALEAPDHQDGRLVDAVV